MIDNHASMIDRSSAGVVRLMRAVAPGHGNGIRGTSRADNPSTVESKGDLYPLQLDLPSTPKYESTLKYPARHEMAVEVEVTNYLEGTIQN